MKKIIIAFVIVGVLGYCLYAQPGPIQPIITNLTQFKNQTAWRLFYSNTDGDVTELALGASGYLKTNGATSAPTWSSPTGAGDLLADGSIPLTANWDVGNYDITLKSLTGDGTIEGATITEGGNAVYSSGETPSGELGGTYANITIDDNVSVSGWTLVSPTFTTGITATDLIDSAHYVADSIDNEHINWGDIDYLDDEGAVDIAAYAAVGTFESGDTFLVLEAGVGIREADYDNLPSASATAWDDIADPDLAATIDFVTYTQTIDIGVTDDGGSKSGLILDVTGLGAGTTDVIALEITTATDDDTDYIPIAIYDDSGGDNDLLFYIDSAGGLTSSGIVTGSSFAGVGTNVTNVDAVTGDSATAFFDAGTIEHEWGGLQADISGYTGLIGITGADTTVEVDLLSELLTAMGDVTAFITDDDMPAAGTDPDVDAAGEIGRDTDDHSLRGYDGSAQYLYSAKDKPRQFTITEPDSLVESDNLVVWTNNTAFTFNITEIQAVADTDDATFTIKEVDADGANATTIEAVTISTDGTNMYYTTVAVGDIDHKVIEAGHRIMYDASAFDTDYIHVALEGYFDSDVN